MFLHDGHSIKVPVAIEVILISLLHLGHGISYSFVSRTSNLGPSTIEGKLVIDSFLYANPNSVLDRVRNYGTRQILCW